MGRKMTTEEINEMVRVKISNLQYIQETFGIWSYPFSSENASLKYWMRVQRGEEPTPEVEGE